MITLILSSERIHTEISTLLTYMVKDVCWVRQKPYSLIMASKGDCLLHVPLLFVFFLFRLLIRTDAESLLRTTLPL